MENWTGLTVHAEDPLAWIILVLSIGTVAVNVINFVRMMKCNAIQKWMYAATVIDALFILYIYARVLFDGYPSASWIRVALALTLSILISNGLVSLWRCDDGRNKR